MYTDIDKSAFSTKILLLITNLMTKSENVISESKWLFYNILVYCNRNQSDFSLQMSGWKRYKIMDLASKIIIYS